MKSILSVIGFALAACADRLGGRALAINSDETAALEAQVGIPAGVSATAVAARKAALIAGGTPPIYAEVLAIDAERAQMARDEAIKRRLSPSRLPRSARRKASLMRRRSTARGLPPKRSLPRSKSLMNHAKML